MRTDSEIKSDVEEELHWVPDVDDSDVSVKVSHGIVTLTGSVPNYLDKSQAECAAKRVLGCAGIANDIEVRLATSDRWSDPEIVRGAVEAIRADLPDIADGVQVLVHDGHVTLEGAVEWNWQRQRLESNVRNVRGVAVVTNLIAIRPRPIAHDIQRMIQDAFRRSAELDASRVSVETKGDEVTLRGKVRSLHEKDEAQRTAWYAPGVTRVVNEISVSSG